MGKPMKLHNLKLLQLNTKLPSGNIYDWIAANQIISDFNYRNQSGVYGELDPDGNFDTSLNKACLFIRTLKIEENYIIGDIDIISTINGKLLKEILRPFENFINSIKGINRERKIDSILEDYYEYEEATIEEILDMVGIKFLPRIAGIIDENNVVKVKKFFTFDAHFVNNKETVFPKK